MSSKKRGAGDGAAMCVSSWAITSLRRVLEIADRSRWIVSPVVAATLPTDRSARRDAVSVDNITGRGPAMASASGWNDVGSGAGRLRTVRESSLMNCAATRSAGRCASTSACR